MLTIENAETFGWEAAIRGMRNPKNSWSKSDSRWSSPDENGTDAPMFIVGENDLKLASALANSGADDGKFLRMIHVQLDVTAPMYWWSEADTYKVGTVANSCSTMHKIADKEFTLEDFSYEHLENSWLAHLKETIRLLNEARDAYHWCNTDAKKEWWWQMIQLLPSSYNQKRTVMLNYEVLANIYKSRRNHKLDEWHIFCDWMESLPYSKLITGEK